VRRLLLVGTTVILAGFVATEGLWSNLRAQSATPSLVLHPSEATALAGQSAHPVVVASGISVRALSVNRFAATPPPAEAVYFTAANDPNRVLSMVPTIAAPASGMHANSFAPFAGTGAAGFLGDGGAAANAQFSLDLDSVWTRSGVAVAADGTLFVADTKNATIRAIAGPLSSEPAIVRSVAGRWAPAQSVSLVEPMGIAADRAGNLYIADHAANDLLMLHAATGLLEVLAHFVSPASVAVTADGRKLFAASPETSSIVSLDLQTRNVQPLFSADAGAQKIVPSGLALDGGENLFIADANGNRILRIDPRSGALLAVASSLHSPGEIAFDARGDLFVADQAKAEIIEFTALGQSASGITLTPSGFDFGNEPTGGASATEVFTLANNSGAAITGVTFVFQGGDTLDFTVQSTSCVATLANGSSCTANVAFTPTATGARASTLFAQNSAATQAANVSGTGDDYELSLASGQTKSVTVTAGDTATYNLQASNDTVFQGTVTLVCPGNMPTAALCSFSAPAVSFSAPSQTAPFKLMIQTTSRTKVPGTEVPPAITGPRGPTALFPALLSALAMALLALLSWGRLRGARRHRKAAALAVLMAAATTAALLAGCHRKGLTINGTPAGTYNLIVQGTAQNATRAVGITLVVN
jgi:sugar lactone lactonase YvrE